MKDNFSKHSAQYSVYRPSYPTELFDFLISLVPDKKAAWDCGTGNGQVAINLSPLFEKVYATDISENQINHAVKRDNIFYKKESAESSSFANGQFDLITAGMSVHWFDFSAFYAEVKRTLKNKGIVAVFGYSLLTTIDKSINRILNHFYHNVIGQYWDKERRYVDENYCTIPFPFDRISTPSFVSRYEWSLDHLIGYLNTWSAVQHFKDKNNSNPVELIIDELEKTWDADESKLVTFPILVRVGLKKDNH